jgi:glycosyltransferase involved in cell wall biosynthesis
MEPGLRRHIVIDARTVVANQSHGIARHTSELLEQFLLNPPEDFRFTLLVHPSSPYLKRQLPPSFSLQVMRKGWLSPLGQIELNWTLWKLKPDLFHSPSFVVSLLSSFPFVATIHDLIHVKMAREYTILHQLYYRFFLTWRVKKAAAIITVSEFSKQEIIRFFCLPADKVHVIYNGMSSDFHRIASPAPEVVQSFRDKYELPERFILSVGNKKSHKNILRLVEAWCQGNFSEDLVLLTEFDPKILQIAGNFNKRHRIFFVRFVPDSDLPMLYSLARLFVYPSLYEGFGLPPLEAAACEVPLVVSKVSSLPEVMGDSAVYVNPLDVADIARGIHECLNATPEKTRENIQKGLERTKRYSWVRMGQESLALYREACK